MVFVVRNARDVLISARREVLARVSQDRLSLALRLGGRTQLSDLTPRTYKAKPSSRLLASKDVVVTNHEAIRVNTSVSELMLFREMPPAVLGDGSRRAKGPTRLTLPAS